MYNQVIFYNHFGAGDVFESREFVKDWMKLVPSNSYFYSHGKDPKILRDIPELQFKAITEHMDPMKSVWDDLNGNLYVNTWIGRDGRYVLPGIGCVVEELYRMHNDMLRSYNTRQLPRSIIEYIPNIDYSYYDTKNVDKFVNDHPQSKVLVCNGPAQSMQAENFDLDSIIYLIAETFPDKLFIFTQGQHKQLPNIFTTEEIIKSGEFDLNEVSYLSRFCDVIVGRNSGPHVFSQVLDNWMDERKKIVSFTYTNIASTFVLKQPTKMKKYWSSSVDNYNVTKFLIEVIE